LGGISRPMHNYFNQLTDKKIKILIPGCGNAYEADYLLELGFKKVFILDWSEKIISEFKKRLPKFPARNIIMEDFFIHKGKYDLIIEQTFFCAIDRNLRTQYAKKVYELLKPGGKLVGVLFNHEFDSDSPPFGGSEQEYRNYFKPYFEFKNFSPAFNSIKPRAGRELFIILKKL
jgi:SAM-dependent methyltransferase